MEVVYRPLGADDVEHVHWALCAALACDPVRVLPPPELMLEHPEVTRHHRDWGRDGHVDRRPKRCVHR